MAAAGASTVRGFHTSKTPAELWPFRDAKLSLSGILMWSPSRPMTLPVSDLAGFKHYVTTLVSRYRGVVPSWEVWNEPPNFTKDTSPASYAAVVAAAYAAAKAVDPNVQIGLAAKSVHIRYLAEAIAAGARNKFDFISLHPYELAGLIPHGCERSFLGIVGNVRAMLRERNPERVDVPIRFTEIGVELREKGNLPIDEATQADLLVKIYSMAFAQGVEQVDWFDPRDSEGKRHGLLRANSTARPAYEAYKQLRAALGGRPKFLGYISLAPDSLGFLFAGPESDVIVTWLLQHKARELTLADVGTVVAPDTGKRERTNRLSLGNAARLISAPQGSPLSADWRKRATVKRATWDGRNDTAALELSPDATARAICLVNERSIEKRDAKPELNLAHSRGAWFAVDPEFIGYSAVPVEVTLVARGDGKHTGGFNFKYESQKPIRAANENGMVAKGHWNTVRGTAPVTFTWRIDDASFVSKYGPNLGIDCDGPEHCNFSILSLKLRKLNSLR